MIKAFVLVLLFLSVIDARENPFFPIEGEKDITYTSNDDKSKPPLKRATITLPSYARVIESVTINYKNLDGSQESRTVELDNSIDWHLPVFVSQSYSKMEEKPRSERKNKQYKKIAHIKYTSFFTFKKSLKVVTQDKLIRNFLLVKPHRIVLDFKRDTNLKTYIKANPKSVFKKIRVGNHSGYYRVVIELDGYYRYKLQKIKGAYLFTLK